MYKLTYVLVFGLVLLSKMSIAALTPIVTNAIPKPMNPGATVEWSSIELPENNNVIPCAGHQLCVYGVFVYFLSGLNDKRTDVFSIDRDQYRRTIRVYAGMTWSQAAEAFIRTYGPSGRSGPSIWAWQPKFWQLCMAAGYTATVTIGPPYLASGGTCQTIPQVPTACNVEGRADIVHGLISSDKINGHKASTLLYMNCTAPAEVRLRILPEKIDLGGGVTSQVTVNGLGNGGIISSTGNTTLTVQSQLSSTGASPGAHVGAGVIMFDVQ
ncbi:hypothetical protein [Serratia aquatilis]|uniref:Adhesin n=1 Tax=Serratia aquatilis TaxID=1737515 RepID=A0ABV6EC38_9GAMM